MSIPSVQVPPFWQGLLAHSSISDENNINFSRCDNKELRQCIQSIIKTTYCKITSYIFIYYNYASSYFYILHSVLIYTTHSSFYILNYSPSHSFSSHKHSSGQTRHFVGSHPNRRIRNFRVRIIFRDNRVWSLPIFSIWLLHFYIWHFQLFL